jgi:hypothetical protein
MVNDSTSVTDRKKSHEAVSAKTRRRRNRVAAAGPARMRGVPAPPLVAHCDGARGSPSLAEEEHKIVSV